MISYDAWSADTMSICHHMETCEADKKFRLPRISILNGDNDDGDIHKNMAQIQHIP